MLELLEKRGPRAFEKFVLILQENYDWLADKLKVEFQKRNQSNSFHGNCAISSEIQLIKMPILLSVQPNPFIKW